MRNQHRILKWGLCAAILVSVGFSATLNVNAKSTDVQVKLTKQATSSAVAPIVPPKDTSTATSSTATTSSDSTSSSSSDSANSTASTTTAATGNQGTGAKGYLTIDYVSNLDFGKHAITDRPLRLTATNQQVLIQVSDRRQVASGWSLQIKPSGLQSNTHQLVSQLDWGQAGHLSTTPGSVSEAPRQVSPGPLTNQHWQSILTAKAHTGIGTWALTMDPKDGPLQLILPAQRWVAGSYQGQLDWQLVSAPLH